MNEIIEDAISRNREFQKERHARVNRLKELKAPQVLIDHEEFIAKMTLAEYLLYLKEKEKEYEKQKSEYIKNNPIQQSIVDEIYKRESQLDYNKVTYEDYVIFLIKMDTMSFINGGDHEYGIYETFLTHAHDIYIERYQTRYLEESGFDNEQNSN